MTNMNRAIAINVKALVPTRKLDPEDTAVAGVYQVTVPNDVRDEQAASIALDAFHESVAISTLDDFDISVFDLETGMSLDEDEDTESYINGSYGSYEGSIADKAWNVYQVTINNLNKYEEIFVYAPTLVEAKAYINKDKYNIEPDDVVVVKPWRNN